MKPENLFKQILLFFSFLSLVAGVTWLKIGIPVSGYFDFDDNDDGAYYQVLLLAGRTYNIVLLGDYYLDTWLGVSDPAGNDYSNDDWGGGGDYDESSVVNMSPAVDGICSINAESYFDGDYYLLVQDISPCSDLCTSKPFSILIELNFEGCQYASPLCSDSLCQSGHLCSSCSGGLIPLGAACISTCPPGTYASSSTCNCKPFLLNIFQILLACSDYGSSCLTCDTSLCLSCDSGYAYQGSCLDYCPSGTYTTSGACIGKRNPFYLSLI